MWWRGNIPPTLSGQINIPAALPPKKEPPVSHDIGGPVGPRAGLNTVKKREISLPLPEIEPRPSTQPILLREFLKWIFLDGMMSYTFIFEPEFNNK
jgi:hypothetical protein